MSQTQKPLTAMLFDIENDIGFCVEHGWQFDAGLIVDRVATIANPVIRHSFGDISAMPKEISKYKLRQNLHQNHVTQQDVYHLPGTKNSADIALTVHAMHLAHTRPDIGCFVIVANDRDFICPINYLRGLGKVVIGVGPSRSLVNPIYLSAFDQFIFYDELIANAAQVGEVIVSESASTAAAPLAVATGDHISQDAARLIAAIRGIEARGTAARAPAVGSLMHSLYPEFDPKKSYGSFKQFCQRMVESGAVQVSDLSDPAFVLSVANSAVEVAIDSVVGVEKVISDGALENSYAGWVLQKMKMSMPAATQRQAIYEALVDTLACRQNQLPVPLKTLAADIGQKLPGMENVAFRVLYGLFRCRALTCALTSDSFNPGVASIKVPVERLDLHFVVNTLSVFRRDNTGLPLDPAAWSIVFYGDTSAAQAIGMVAELDSLADATSLALSA